MKFFDTITFLSIFLLLAGSLSAQDCPDFTQNNLVRTTENCQSGIIECLPIEFDFAEEYEYTLDGVPYNGSLSPCGFGTIAAYDVLGIGNYPINIDSWEVNGLVYNNFIADSPNALADSLSLLSGAPWTFDDVNFKVQTTNAPDSLGWLSWTEINTGLSASTLPEFSSNPSQTGFEFPIGNHVFVAYSFLDDCADTLLIDVVCQQITDTLVFNILEGDTDSIFFDTSNLGPIDYFANECATQSGAYVDFQTISGTNSLYFEGILPGTEQACIVMCDVNGNCDTTYVFVTVDPFISCTDPVIDFVNVIDKNCDEPGSIQIYMEDPNQVYNFNWDNNQPNTDYLINLEAGIYNVTITTGDSTQQVCTTTASYTVNFLDDMEPFGHWITPSCNGNNGIVTFEPIGLTYTWEDGFVGSERYDLFPGQYNVTVSSNNCEEVTSVFMVDSGMEVLGTVNNVCDSLGAIYLDVSGGLSPYAFFWDDGANTSARYDLGEGIYMVTVTDANGCTAENNFEVIDDCPSVGCITPVITNVITVEPTCSDNGSITIEVLDNSLDYLYSWTHNGPNSATQVGLLPGDYGVVVSNISSTGEVCSDTAEVVLVLNDSLDFFLLNSIDASCAAPGFAEYSNPNLMYTWSDGGIGYLRDDLVAGNYTITVSDPNSGCVAGEFLTIQQGSEIELSGFAANVCDTLGSIYLSVSGGSWPYTYQWSNGVNTLSQPELNVGIYTITVTDAQGCTLVQTYEIVDDCSGTGCVDPVLTDIIISNPNCMEDGWIDVQVENMTPNVAYNWSNGSDLPMQIDLPAGVYSLTVSDFDPVSGDSCFTVETFVLVAEDSLGVSLTNIAPATCGSLGSAEYSDPTLIYNWSDGGFGHMRDDLTPGSYDVTITNSQETCIEVSFIVIEEINNMVISANVANVCDTLGSIYMNVDGGLWPYTYQWSNGTITNSQPALDVGTYSVTVTDANACTVTETFVIVDDCSTSGCIEPIIVATEIIDPNCNGPGTILLEVGNFDPNMSYDWSHGGPDSNIQTELPAGDYEVTISNIDVATGETCFTTASFTLFQNDSLGIFLVSSTPAGCNGPGTAQYSDPSLIYNWSDGGFGYIRDDLAAGTYTITVTNSDESCTELSFLTIVDAGAIDASAIVSNVCDTLGSIYMSVNGGSWPYAYDWADLPGSNDPEDRESIDVGNYTVTITDATGCQLTLNFEIVDDCPTTGDLIFTFFPADMDIECGEMAPVESPIAESDCPGDIIYDFTETQAPNCGNTNILTRTWVATDNCGNTASAVQTIFEQDFEAPELITVGDFIVDLLNGDSLPDPLGFATAEDDCGLIADLSYTKEESITDDGYQVAYTWTAIDECGNLSTALHTVEVTGGMIWPGDTDSNKVVNNFDVFNIGFAYGATGPTRMSPTLDFLPQYAAPWSENGIDEVNFRHADTDGNGIVDEQDILAVNLNYDLVHNLQPEGDTRETFEVDFVYETVTADNWVHVAVILGSEAEPIDDFYGAGFIIEYDQNMVVPNTAHIDFSDSWTGTFFNDFVALQKDFHDEGRLDIGLVRTNQLGVGGFGKIGSFRFQLPEGVEFTPFMLTARQGEGVRADKSPYELETTEVVVTDVKEILPPSAIEIYPNPVQTELLLDIPTELEVTNIQLFGTNGQMVKQYTDLTNRRLEVSAFPAGLYYLRILTTEGTWTDKVSIIK